MAEQADMRMAALDTLMAVDKGERRLDQAVSDVLVQNQFAPRRDRAFYRRICEGVTERKIYLDYVIDHYSSRPVRKCKPLIRSLLRMSAYQILFMDVRDAAACNEAVKIAKKRHFRNLSGFVNGLLRTISREKENLPVPDRAKNCEEYYSVMYSMPAWIVRLLLKQYGEEETGIILKAMEETSPLSIRVNENKITKEELTKKLELEGVTVTPGEYSPHALRLSGVDFLEKLPSFREGDYLVQDESSMLVAEIAGVKKQDQILDLCSAPGGKTFDCAQMAREGHVTARDLTEYKTDLLMENKDRLGFTNVTVECRDATEFDQESEKAMDLVIADLPCSGLGVMGRKNDIRYNLSEDQLASLVKLQRQILTNAWRYVKPGGTLIYSTCTLNREENQVNAAWIEDNTPLKLDSIEEDLPEKLRGRTGKQGYLQLVPGKDSCDGLFLAKFKRPLEDS